MYQILIDGCLDYLEIGILENRKIIYSKITKLNKNFTYIFNNEIESILKSLNIKNNDIESIYLINGPGSFTSTKLISLFANTFKFVYNHLKIYELNSLEWMITKDMEIACIDAKSGLFFLGVKNKFPVLVRQSDVKKIYDDYSFYIYTFDSKKDINIKWEKNKNNFIEVKYSRPLYIKPAVYDSSK